MDRGGRNGLVVKTDPAHGFETVSSGPALDQPARMGCDCGQSMGSGRAMDLLDKVGRLRGADSSQHCVYEWRGGSFVRRFHHLNAFENRRAGGELATEIAVDTHPCGER